MALALAVLAARQPTQPAISAVALSATAIQISLTSASVEPISGIAFYSLWVSAHGGPFVETQQISTGAFPFTLGSLSPSTAYQFYVTATDGSVNEDTSQPSATVSVTTPGSSVPTPSTPGITATALSSSSIQIALTTPSTEPVNGIKNYVLLRLVGGSGFNQLVTLLPSQWPYTDTGLSASTAYSYQTYAVDNDAALTPSANSATTTAATQSSGSNPSLKQYLDTLGANKDGVLCCQHSEYFEQSNGSGAPMSGFVGSNPNWTIPGTGLCPAGLGTNVQGPYNGTLPTQQTLTGQSSWLTISSNWLNANRILQVSFFANNPANPNAGGSWLSNPALGDGGNDQTHNPFPGILNNNGNSTYNNWIANLAQIATLIKQLNAATGNKPFIFRQFHELTLGQGTGQWWWDIGGSAPFCTGAQLAQLYRNTRAYFVSQGITNMLYTYNVNAGSTGNYSQAYPDTIGAAYVQGTSNVDIIGIDAYPPSAGDQTLWNLMAAMAPGRPMIYGEAGVHTFDNSQVGVDGYNNYTNLMQIISSNCPGVCAAFIMSQNWALYNQLGATQAMSTAPMLNAANLPAGI